MKNTILVESLESGEKEYCVKKNTHLTLVLQSFHDKRIDSKVRIRLQGEGAGATIIGLIIASGDSVIRLHTMQQHEAPSTTSNLLIKTALYGDSHCTIEGGIRVETSAQKTDAYQRNENLVMSSGAYAESKPSLEILANDVRCTHGATVGPVSEEELWYLATRGIPRNKAEPLIVSGFFQKAIDMIGDSNIREHLWKTLARAVY